MRSASILLSLVFSTLLACAPSKKELVQNQYSRSTLIGVVCEDGSQSMGSGVIVSKDTILTASHVVDCDGLYVVVKFSDGTNTLATRTSFDPIRDLARLHASGIDAPRVAIGPRPEPGDTVCLTPAYPRRDRKCGEVYVEEGDVDSQIRFSAKVEPGNSGSGLYNSDGELVGIVTKYEFGRHGITGGMASALR